MKRRINSSKAPKVIGPYSQAIVISNYLFTAGTIHLSGSGELTGNTPQEKMRQVMVNLKFILNKANFDFDNVVKVTVYLTNLHEIDQINEVYKSFMNEPYPARETIQVSRLPKGADIEVSMIAYKDIK